VLTAVAVHQRDDRLLGGGVEGQQRLVAQQQLRPSGQCLGGQQPLLLTAGQQPDRGVRPQVEVAAAGFVDAWTHRFRHHFSHTWLDRGGAERGVAPLGERAALAGLGQGR
jgi:hypothetical protein